MSALHLYYWFVLPSNPPKKMLSLLTWKPLDTTVEVSRFWRGVPFHRGRFQHLTPPPRKGWGGENEYRIRPNGDSDFFPPPWGDVGDYLCLWCTLKMTKRISYNLAENQRTSDSCMMGNVVMFWSSNHTLNPEFLRPTFCFIPVCFV